MALLAEIPEHVGPARDRRVVRLARERSGRLYAHVPRLVPGLERSRLSDLMPALGRRGHDVDRRCADGVDEILTVHLPGTRTVGDLTGDDRRHDRDVIRVGVGRRLCRRARDDGALHRARDVAAARRLNVGRGRSWHPRRQRHDQSEPLLQLSRIRSLRRSPRRSLPRGPRGRALPRVPPSLASASSGVRAVPSRRAARARNRPRRARRAR